MVDKVICNGVDFSKDYSDQILVNDKNGILDWISWEDSETFVNCAS